MRQINYSFPIDIYASIIYNKYDLKMHIYADIGRKGVAYDRKKAVFRQIN